MKLYFMGIGGLMMGNVALIARQLGDNVVGSDTILYPPLEKLLRDNGCEILKGYSPENLQNVSPDAVIIGNAIGRGNPELEWFWDKKPFKFYSLPEFIRERVLEGRKTIAVCGTHGKTTTTTLAAYLLKNNGANPGWLIGGVPQDLPSGAEVGGVGTPFVIEGDEYDSAFFDKRAKFISYRPTIAVINNIEVDHLDIYRDLEDIKRSFNHMLRVIPSSGVVIANRDDENIRSLLPVKWVNTLWVSALDDPQADLLIKNYAETPEGSSFELVWRGKLWGKIAWGLGGLFNARNAAMASLAAACGSLSDVVTPGRGPATGGYLECNPQGVERSEVQKNNIGGSGVSKTDGIYSEAAGVGAAEPSNNSSFLGRTGRHCEGTMKWTEIVLYGVLPLRPCGNQIAPLHFRGKQIATVERRELGDRIDGLTVHFDTGVNVELRAAVDVSERLDRPRVFVFEAAPLDTFLVLGGEKAYWLTCDGAVKAESPLFRKWGEEEYWTTQIIEQENGAIVIYEAGVLAIDEALQVRWHKPKLLNDDFVAVEGNLLKFARDHDAEWFMSLEDGGTPQWGAAPSNNSPCIGAGEQGLGGWSQFDPTSLDLSTLANYLGVKRRQEIRHRSDSLVVVEDFAHHPTAVTLTLQSLRARFPGYRWIACLEPRSATVRTHAHQLTFPAALANADVTVLAPVHNAATLPPEKRLDTARVAEEIRAKGLAAHALKSCDEIPALLDKLTSEISQPTGVVFFSNGNFEGAMAKWLEKLSVAV